MCNGFRHRQAQSNDCFKNQGGANENYFDRLYQIFDGQNEEAEYYIDQMTAAMNESKDYSVILESDIERICTEA